MRESDALDYEARDAEKQQLVFHVEVIRRIEQVAQPPHGFRRVSVPCGDEHALDRNFVVAPAPPLLDRSRMAALGDRAADDLVAAADRYERFEREGEPLDHAIGWTFEPQRHDRTYRADGGHLRPDFVRIGRPHPVRVPEQEIRRQGSEETVPPKEVIGYAYYQRRIRYYR